MGLTIKGTDAVSKVSIVVTYPYNAKKDDGTDRRRVKNLATGFLEAVIGKPISVTHGIAGARGNRAAWTLAAELKNLALMDGKERRGVIATIKKSAQTWATKNVGRGAKVALTVE